MPRNIEKKEAFFRSEWKNILPRIAGLSTCLPKGIYDWQLNYTKAKDYFSQNLKISEEIGDKKRVSDVLDDFDVFMRSKGIITKRSNTRPKAKILMKNLILRKK